MLSAALWKAADMTPLHSDTLVIDDISRCSADLAALLDSNDASTPVKTCGDWTLGDLVWHLSEVQLFWSHIIGDRPEGPETYDPPTRPVEGELSGVLRAAGNELVKLLHAADPKDEAWSWSNDHTVGFTIRRQVHEALIHGIDGIFAVGATMPEVPPRLVADGIDEVVGVMLTGTPDWATFEASDDVVELRAMDTDDRWIMRAGKIVGTEPTSGTDLELDGYELDDDAVPTATIEAPALDLLLWMWGRRDAPALDEPGGVQAAGALRRAIVGVTQ